MQYLAHRGGPQWVSDGEPSDQAIDAALLTEMARRVGMDWFEADAQIQNHAPDEAEAEAAADQAQAYTDDLLAHALLRMMAARRAELARFQTARLMHMSARDVMETDQ
ncbi:MAG: hypothetical protein EBY30_04430 [Rhodospirillales bacterium]|nr:hypothetical protein [Rhodospirillales bacterium]